MAISDDDVRAAADLIKVDPATIRAVMEVEAAGKPFGPDWRPTILFEPHIFYQEVPAPKRVAAVNAGVAYAKWRTRPYPAHQAARWQQFDTAAGFDRPAAIRSTSFGLGQIMGFNFKRAGFATEDAFFQAMRDSEKAQLLAMVRLIRSMRLDDELQNRDWAAFAHGYNGDNYAVNRYDQKLAAAFRKWSKAA